MNSPLLVVYGKGWIGCVVQARSMMLGINTALEVNERVGRDCGSLWTSLNSTLEIKERWTQKRRTMFSPPKEKRTSTQGFGSEE